MHRRTSNSSAWLNVATKPKATYYNAVLYSGQAITAEGFPAIVLSAATSGATAFST